jgi:hypothetical protein
MEPLPATWRAARLAWTERARAGWTAAGLEELEARVAGRLVVPVARAGWMAM